MSVVVFVLLLGIPAAMIAKKNPFAALLLTIWGFALGLTPMGPGIAQLLDQVGGTVMGLFA